MVWTLSFQCRGPGFHPWSANKIPHAPRVCISKLQILPAETKTWCSQINNLKKQKVLSETRKLSRSMRKKRLRFLVPKLIFLVLLKILLPFLRG